MANKITISDDLSIDPYADPRLNGDPEGKKAAREKRVARVRLLWVERRFLFRWALVGMILASVIGFIVPSRFVSTTRLMPPDQVNSSMAMLAAAADTKGGAGSGIGSVASDLLGLKSSGALFVGILQSRTVRDDLIDKFDLRKVYRHRRWEDARLSLAKNTNVSEETKSGIITIQVTDKNPQRAASMAQEYVAELNRVVAQLNTTAAHRERVFLEGRLGEVQTDLETAEKDFSEFASQNSAIDIPAQGKATIEAGAALEGELIGARTELQSVKQVYADGNVRVRAAQARVNELERQLEKLGGKYDTDITASSDADQKMYPSIRRLPLLGVNYADLFRNVKVQEAVFETLTQQYELARVEEAKETPSVKVIDVGDVPEKKSLLDSLWIPIVGAAVLFFFAAAWILGGEYWVHIESDDPGKLLAQEVVGVMKSHWPFNSENRRGAAGPRQNRWIRLLAQRASTTASSGSGKPEK